MKIKIINMNKNTQNIEKWYLIHKRKQQNMKGDEQIVIQI
jgi:hypothetical protein